MDESIKLFMMKDYHIELLKNSNIAINENTGGFLHHPVIPYGNTNIYDTIKKLVGGMYDGELTTDICKQIHEQIPIALEVCIQSQSFIPGAYSKRPGSKWVRQK